VSVALDELLRAWRSCRDPELADRLDALDRLTPAEPLVPITASDAEHHRVWLQVAAAADPRTLRALRRGLWPGSGPAFAEVVAALARWPADPRIARLFAQAVRDRPLRSRSAFGPLKQALAHLQTLDDPRVVRWLPRPGVRELEPTLSAVWAWFEARPVPRFMDQERVGLGLDVGPPSCVTVGPDGPPEDHSSLAVLSDALQERGDPLGRLWALQLDGSRPAFAEANRWIRRYGWAWTPAALRVAVRGSPRFEFGRVRAVALDVEQLAWACQTFGEPVWRGVSEITLRGSTMRDPGALRGLPSLDVVRWGEFAPVLEVLRDA
jgi:hypothetical protein